MERKVLTFDVKDVGTFSMHAEPTVQESYDIDSRVVEILGGAEKYAALESDIDKLEQYQDDKNVAILGRDEYDKIREQLRALVRGRKTESDKEKKASDKLFDELNKKLFFDYRIGKLFSLRGELARVRQIAEYDVLIFKRPDGFEQKMSDVVISIWEQIRQATEACLTNFRENGQKDKTPKAT